ncbi:YdcF family protein [Speluncibacter jeojiensis]|uniref:YdcF family protein n=1 Tax=Speluncibacter jeojiensis TaxID=2710754 RepID=A0A9X4LW85_9ACTN|nr:YdcF family protein [Rhodococcus sp. D2-41]MDG3013528.1 YdcF family protein [Corynebacteriales bacterium D3-21]
MSTTFRRAIACTAAVVALAGAGTGVAQAEGSLGSAGSSGSVDLLPSGSAGMLPSSGSAALPSTTAITNAVLSTVGGCQTPVPELIRLCSETQTLISEPPLMLKLNPFGTHIVVLGAGLFPNGTIRPVLDSRLQAARALAVMFPTAPIIVSGGVPQSGRTEAQAMFDWLTASGIPAQRIIREGTSRSTVENAANTNRILADRGATGAVVVTSPDHLRRALIDFRNAVGGRIPVDGVISAG